MCIRDSDMRVQIIPIRLNSVDHEACKICEEQKHMQERVKLPQKIYSAVKISESPGSVMARVDTLWYLSLIHISEPTRRTPISYAVFCLKKKKDHSLDCKKIFCDILQLLWVILM
eukprot:TRINITY_DN29_c0_g1_i9.p1 TRINITY_DN29_c0_g1~~TRINITY_DN29_c0_g1_i9.p1  ORF type:complete len:115 (+),score=23.04 TRINITY_DN29_c0_g1_i9:66-410(+)